MNDRYRDFERFLRALDAEWLRARLRTGERVEVSPEEADGVLAALVAGDPLASPRETWLDAIRAALASWPGRVSFAAVACALVLLGVAIGWGVRGPGETRVVLEGELAKPAYRAEERHAGSLGIGAPVKPASEGKFREAMAFYTSADFAVRALPLLREAVAADALNDQAQFWLGVALLMTDTPSEAVAPLETAATLAPAALVYKQYLLFAYLRTGAVAKALKVQAELMKGR